MPNKLKNDPIDLDKYIMLNKEFFFGLIITKTK